MSRSARVYRMLLLAYPRDFRCEYGLQMEQAFGDLYREACERGERSTIARRSWSMVTGSDSCSIL